MGFQAVDQDGDEDDGSVDDFLHVRFNAGEVHAVVDDGNDEGSDERAEDPALATGQTGAANDYRRDDFQFHEVAGLGITGDVERRLHDAAEACKQPGERVDEHQHPFDRYAGKSSSLRVASNSVNVAADRGAGHDHVGNREQD